MILLAELQDMPDGFSGSLPVTEFAIALALALLALVAWLFWKGWQA